MTMNNLNVAAAQVVVRSQFPRFALAGLLFMVIVLMLASARVMAAQDEELDSTIQHLIAFVQHSDVRFERNFFSHNSLDAAQHIEKKYQHFKDEIDTPEKFIELCATRSLVTGMEYQVFMADGTDLPAGEWLNLELARYRAGGGQE